MQIHTFIWKHLQWTFLTRKSKIEKTCRGHGFCAQTRNVVATKNCCVPQIFSPIQKRLDLDSVTFSTISRLHSDWPLVSGEKNKRKLPSKPYSEQPLQHQWLPSLSPSNAEATYIQSTRTQNHLNPVMLVFIGKLSLNILRRVPYARVSVIFQRFLVILSWQN